MYRYVILSSLKKLQYERSVSAVYYLIQGKQSIQTIQDAHLFGLRHVYRIAKHVEKEMFMKEINMLKQEKYLLALPKENHYELTSKAYEWLEAYEQKMNSWHVNGMRYHHIDDVYFERLLLVIQVWTNYVQNERSYIPVVDKQDVKEWVKHYFIKTKKNVPTLLHTLYEELVVIFNKLNELYVEIFVLQLTSYKRYGLAKVQIAEQYNLQKEDVELITLSVIHHILQMIDKEPTRFQLLHQIKIDLIEEKRLTMSASKTNELLQNGWSIEQIAQHRRLKENTIFDHIVEIALHDEAFNLQAYMTIEQQNDIIKAIQHVKSYSLKEIKQTVDDTISYFQIRLVLASWNKFIE